MIGYRTVLSAGEAEFSEKRSRFIGRLAPAKSEEEATAFITAIKKRHHDAAHNVWAYILRDDNVERFSDDGEPQGTGGVPVLTVLRRQGLFDAVCVVTRYFGGVLLGAGGLVRAYSHGAAIASKAAVTGVMAMQQVFLLPCPYPLLEIMKAALLAEGAAMDDIDYGEQALITLSARAGLGELLSKTVTEKSRGALALKFIRSEYRAVPDTPPPL